MGIFLGRDQILAAHDAVTEEVEVPEWGGKVLVKSLTSAERDSYEKSLMVKEGTGRKASQIVNLINARAKLAVLAMVAEDGQQLFSYEDIPALSRKSAAALGRVADVAMRLAGLTNEDMEKIEGNSENPQRDSSATG